MRPWNKESKERRSKANIPRRISRTSDDGYARNPPGGVGHPGGLAPFDDFGRHSWPTIDADFQRPLIGSQISSEGVGNKPKVQGGRHKSLSSLNPAASAAKLPAAGYHSPALPPAPGATPKQHKSWVPPNSNQSPFVDYYSKLGKPPKQQQEAAQLHADQINNHMDRNATPNVLYKDQFLMQTKSAQAFNEHIAHITTSMPQPDFPDAPPRLWQQMEMRMPACRSQEEAAVISATARVIVAKGVSLRIVDKNHMVLDMSLTQRPTSRLQAELLMGWLGAQIDTITTRGKEARPILLGKTKTGTVEEDAEQLHQAIDSVYGDSHETTDAEMASQLMSLWDNRPQPFMFLDVHEVEVEGIPIRNDKRFLRTMLQVLGTAAAAITHQVTMHCHERGFVLASIWNIQQGLMELAMEQTRLQNDSLAEEICGLKEKLEAASAKAVLVEPLQVKVAELEKTQEGAETQIRALRVEVDEERDQVEKLLRNGKDYADEGSETFQAMQKELDTLRREQADLERQRDVALTAMYSAVASADEARHQVAELISLEEERRSKIKNLEVDDQGTHANIRKLTELSRNLNKVRRVEVMAEEELEDGQSVAGSESTGPGLKRDITMTMMRAKSAATHLEESLNMAEAGESGQGEAAKAGFNSKSVSRRASFVVGKGEQIVSDNLADHIKACEANGVEPSLLSADMSGVDEMTRSEMYKEIEMLKQREVTLAKILQKYQDDSGAPKGSAAVTLLKAILESHSAEKLQKDDLRAKKERMRAKVLEKVKQKGDGLKAVVDEKLHAEIMMQVAMMRLQYRDLWHFCRRSAASDPRGLPPPPEFGQYFEARLKQRTELSKDSDGKMRVSITGERKASKRDPKARRADQKRSNRSFGKLQTFSNLVNASGNAENNPMASGRSSRRTSRASATDTPTPKKSSVAPLSKVLGAVAKTNRFKCQNDALREALYNYQDTPARTPEWALKVVDAVYKAAISLDAKGHKEDGSLPALLMQHFSSQYGAKSLVQEYASAMVATVRKFEKTHIRLEIFSHFLAEEWDFHVLLIYLEAQKLCENAIALPIPFVNYPADTSRAKNPFICTRKAASLADHFLGRRPAECAAGFAIIVDRHAEDAQPDEVASLFVAPSEAETPETEVMGRGSFKKLKMCTFLKLVCKEAQRLHHAIRDAIPKLFREHDADHDGYISRVELGRIFADIRDDAPEWDEGGLWAMSTRIEQTDAAQTGSTAPENHVGLYAFREACMRSSEVRNYLRMAHAPPPPPELNEKDQELQGKMLFMMADRSWREYSKSVSRIVDEMGDFLGADESILRSLMLKIEHEQNGQLKARHIVSIVKLLLDVKVSQLQQLCSPDPNENSSLEETLQTMHDAVKVMYGWNTLMEDDYKKFRDMLDPDCTMTQRQSAGKAWKRSTSVFAVYRRRMEAHASNLLKVEFAAMWLKKHHAMSKSAAGPEGSMTEMRHKAMRQSDLEGALEVMRHDENLEEEEVRLINHTLSPEATVMNMA